MSGIAGWVDFDRDLRGEGAAVRAMGEALRHRGPDGGDVWLDADAGLAHRRLAVLDPQRGRQPMVLDEDGRTTAVLSFSGAVYNHAELRAELRGRGHRFGTGTDAEVVLHAYAEWGESFAERLDGMFGLAVWDPARRSLLLVRDRAGIKPIYYHPTPSGVLFGSEPKALLTHPLVEPVVDVDGLRELLAFVKTPRTASYRGVYEVEPAEIVRISPEGTTTRRYWRLTAREHTDDHDTTVATVRRLLGGAVERQLTSDVGCGTLLSGGLDSSAITALTGRALAERGDGPVRSFAVDFTGQAENFTADVGRGSPDRPFAEELARHGGADHRTLTFSPDELADPGHRLTCLRAYDLPLFMGDMDVSIHRLFAGVRQHTPVVLSGEAADELFAGYRWFHDEALRDADTFPWLADAEHTFAGEGTADTTLLSPELWKLLDLPGYRRERYREALAEVPRLDGEPAADARMRELTYLNLSRFGRLLLDRVDRMSMAAGVEVRVPFCDHRLVEYVFNAPWSAKIAGGQEKGLLRAATRDLLPDSIFGRKKAHYPATQDTEYERAVRRELADLLDDSDSPVGPLLDERRARERLASDPGENSVNFRRRDMENVIQLDRWLRDYDVRLELG
ncbi:asparagine synthase (glutamine-hydrolyzing) [Saccharopolyspora sp. 6T]|uniref:asparagine synthase (glutamine-hydrolyzing) n=1 Tax=Saccharopolyspora sp. 6T TaxID=2877238 RepID=UPI001CD25A90|nr:asparagine synthase (glutamine-hydrolyzing) [Saccharopolyspora sp. 6T]MCA1184915.1 asparagine synthase (glutamine-hydrolyzing) [Saccharopolyspora sp. 6T]